MVTPLSFKGEKKSKKRKRNGNEVSDTSPGDNVSAVVKHDEDDSWSSPSHAGELTGPTVFVLATEPPTCLASDLNGNLYASRLENMIEDDRRTAEPHTVQQVWVASRVAGMAPAEVSFKASHGGYLSCDQYGILGAKREARGREETFTIETIDDEHGRSWYQLQTAATAGKQLEDRRYISASTATSAGKDADADSDNVRSISVSIRGDGEATSPDTQIILRMQTRFKQQTAEAKETARISEKIGRKELENLAGRKLTDDETKRLKRAKREGMLGEALLDVRAKGRHDKYA